MVTGCTGRRTPAGRSSWACFRPPGSVCSHHLSCELSKGNSVLPKIGLSRFIYIYIYIWSPPPQGLPFYFLHERDLFADVQCPLGLQMPCKNTVIYGIFVDIVSDVLSVLDAKQDSRKQQTRKRKAFSDATWSVLKTLLFAVLF